MSLTFLTAAAIAAATAAVSLDKKTGISSLADHKTHCNRAETDIGIP